MDINICVATGAPLWGHETQKGCVLHIPLEDTYERLRKRLWLIADEVEGNLHFAIKAEALGSGLLDQLAMFHGEHPDLKLVIIDTLKMVRSSTRDYSYSSDYRELSDLKRFADEHGVTVLLVNHTRKLGDSDAMNTVSGTNAITGAADFTWVLTKKDGDSTGATVTITGRDVERRNVYIEFRDYRWHLVKDVTAEELATQSIPPYIYEVVAFTRRNGGYAGKTTELTREIGVDDVKPSVFGKRLAQHSMFLEKSGVRFTRDHTSTGSLVTLRILDADDGNDGCDGNSMGGIFPS